MNLEIFAFILLIIFTIEIVFVFIMGASRMKPIKPDLVFDGPPPSIFPRLPRLRRRPGGPGGGPWGPGGHHGGGHHGGGPGGSGGPSGGPGRHPHRHHQHRHHHRHHGNGGGGNGGHSSGKLNGKLVFMIIDKSGKTTTPIYSVPVTKFNSSNTLKQDFSKIFYHKPDDATVLVQYRPSNLDLHWALSNNSNNSNPIHGVGKNGTIKLGTVEKIKGLLNKNNTLLHFKITTN